MINLMNTFTMYALSQGRIKMVDYVIWLVIGSVISIILCKAEGDSV